MYLIQKFLNSIPMNRILSRSTIQTLMNCCYSQGNCTLIVRKYHQNITQDELLIILSKIDCSSLRQISLWDVKISDRVINTLLKLQLNNLYSIDLRRSGIDQEGVLKLLGKRWPSLKNFRLDQNNIGGVGLNKIFENQLLDQLKELNLAENTFTFKGLKKFPTGHLSNLQYLNLYRNNVGNRGVQFLAKCYLPLLEFLNLYDSKVTKKSIHQLGKAQFPKLKRIQIGSNIGITLDSFDSLSEASWKPEFLGTSLRNRLSIHYFYFAIQPLTINKTHKTYVQIEDDQIVEKMEIFVNSNVVFSRMVQF